MMVAHIAGVPFEELLGPLIAAGGGIGIALRSAARYVRAPGRAGARPSAVRCATRRTSAGP
jgi:hypothetical protein